MANSNKVCYKNYQFLGEFIYKCANVLMCKLLLYSTCTIHVQCALLTPRPRVKWSELGGN